MSVVDELFLSAVVYKKALTTIFAKVPTPDLTAELGGLRVTSDLTKTTVF